MLGSKAYHKERKEIRNKLKSHVSYALLCDAEAPKMRQIHMNGGHARLESKPLG